jgi:CRISPR type III-associated protein (TIGR04423 family)
MKRIEKSNYTGYLWYSNKKEPEVFCMNELERELDDNANPFVIEGWLTDGNISHYIKYVNGNHIIKSFDLADLEKRYSSVEKTFVPSFKGFKEMIFKQYWRPVVDENCEGMEVLQPAEFVFTGFNR